VSELSNRDYKIFSVFTLLILSYTQFLS